MTMRGRRGSLVLVLAISALLLVPLLGGAPATAKREKRVKSHEVSMLWTPAEQDTNPSGPRILDTFVASGRPFEESLAKTSTPRALQSEKLKSGRWDIGEPASQQGQREIFCEGTFVIQKTIVETTPGVRQVTKYEGDLRVKECFGKKYHRAEPGHFGEVSGRVVCTTSSCTGGLKINGEIRY